MTKWKWDRKQSQKANVITEELPSVDELFDMEFEEAKEIVSKARDTYTVKTLKNYWGVTDYTLYNIIFKKHGLYEGYPSAGNRRKKSNEELPDDAHQLQYEELNGNMENEIEDENLIGNDNEREDVVEITNASPRLVSLAELYKTVDDEEIENEETSIITHGVPDEIANLLPTHLNKTVYVNNQLINNQVVNHIQSDSIVDEIKDEVKYGFSVKLSGNYMGEKILNKLKGLLAIIEDDADYEIELDIKEIIKK